MRSHGDTRVSHPALPLVTQGSLTGLTTFSQAVVSFCMLPWLPAGTHRLMHVLQLAGITVWLCDTDIRHRRSDHTGKHRNGRLYVRLCVFFDRLLVSSHPPSNPLWCLLSLSSGCCDGHCSSKFQPSIFHLVRRVFHPIALLSCPRWPG